MLARSHASAAGAQLGGRRGPQPLLPGRPGTRAPTRPLVRLAASSSHNATQAAVPGLSPVPGLPGRRQQSARRAVAAQAGWGSSSGGSSGPARDGNPLNALKRELGMQSNRLDPELREAVEQAVAKLGYRVTVGQVAARAGVKLADADAALKALAYDSLGTLEVSDAGEVVYAFEPDFVSRIRSRSWLQRLRPLWKKGVAAANYLARVAFGTALIASALVVWLGVVALMSSRDNDRRSGGYGYGGRGFVFIDPTDLFLVWDPYYARHSRARADGGESMTFVEAVFSFVFGDGNPNDDFEERRWRALGSHIQRLGGVVSAEEMAPFLDPPPLGRRVRRGSEKYEDEAFVLPALIRFSGEPFVDAEGRLLYRFPDLQVVAGAAPSVQLTAAEAKVPLERDWQFSAASPGQQLGALALGALNVVGVVTLSTMLLDPYAKLALLRQGLGFILGLLPYLQTYAAAFFALPALRLAADARRNAAIDARNDSRLQAVSLLQSGDPDLAAKAASARKLGSLKVIGRQDVVYTTDKGTDEQVNAREAAEFDARLSGRGGSGGSSSSSGGRQQQAPPQLGPPRRERFIDDVFGRREQRLRQAEREAAQIEVDWDEAGRGSGGRRGRERGSGGSRGGSQQGRRRDDWSRLDDW